VVTCNWIHAKESTSRLLRQRYELGLESASVSARIEEDLTGE
jgi:Zn-finger protein